MKHTLLTPDQELLCIKRSQGDDPVDKHWLSDSSGGSGYQWDLIDLSLKTHTSMGGNKDPPSTQTSTNDEVATSDDDSEVTFRTSNYEEYRDQRDAVERDVIKYVKDIDNGVRRLVVGRLPDEDRQRLIILLETTKMDLQELHRYN